MKKNEKPYNPNSLIAYHRWLDSLGISRPTGWRWRKQGRLTTINISGRNYVSQDEIARFRKRAEAGEFAGGAK